jgi:cell division protein FtsL
MSEPVQNFQNHARFDPAFHFFLLPLTFLLMIWSFVHHFRVKTIDSFFVSMALLVLLLTIFLVRTYSLKVQDRVIRLEERLRIQSLAGDSMRARIPELTKGQLVALRFASDGEVVALAAKALDEKLTPKQIKAQIQNWRADLFRV